ncbi:hypothetical protein BBP40_010875, partial [Aspergillus hancockii]
MTTPISHIPLSYATCSIGTSPSDTLPAKLSSLHKANFTGIELAFPDILAHGANLLGHEIAPDNYTELVTAAKDIRKQCEVNQLKVMMLQPFANFEGIYFPPPNNMYRQHDVPLSSLDTTKENVVADLRELCDLLAARNMRLAYENWCWSTHAPTWKDVWTIVRAVDRPNIGLCLDTFQTAGSEWGDPTTSTGRIDDLPVEELNARLEKSMEELARSIPPERIYLLQVSDAYRP